ncbi:MAG: MATE family efflux transporter [Planctomycetota bacterium]|jgi:putative MATE family efflux protein|nr:MATE family efflux transporter [Planctomycetota bacterium]
MTSPKADIPENIMGVAPIHRLLLSMSVPMVMSMLVQACYNVVDSIFVASLGENALTAVSLAFPVQMLMIAVAAGTGVGVNSLLSRSLGERNFARVNQTAANGIFLACASSAVFVLFGFLFVGDFLASQTDNAEIVGYGREYLSIVCIGSFGVYNQILFERLLSSTGKTFLSMLAQLSGAITNLILDPIMIFGLFGFPRMETAGAALATVLGQMLAAAIAIRLNLSRNREISFSLLRFRPDSDIIRRIYAVGIPSILMASIGSVMTYGMNLILIPFTTTAAAVFGVYFKLQSLLVMPIFGLNNGMVPIVAYNYGAGARERIVKTIRLSALYAEGVMIGGSLVFQLFPERLLDLFNATGEMLAIGVPALRTIGVHYLFAGFCIVSISTFQALGDGMASLLISFIRQLVVLLPAAWLLSLTGSLDAIWWSFPLAEGATFAVSTFLLRRVYRLKIAGLKPKRNSVVLKG